MKTTRKKYKLIGDRIKDERESAGMSQKELAEAIGFESSTAISLIEAGARKVNVDDLEKIAEILQKDIRFFLGHKIEKPDIGFALRADKELSTADKRTILEFIEFTKRKKDEDRSK